MKVAEAFFEVLRSHGVTTIFGNPGSNELPMLKYLPNDFTYYLGLQEGASIAMADGFAQAGNTVGFVSAHSNSGAGNAIGNLTNVYAGHGPVVVLSGQQSRQYVPLNAMLTNVDAVKLYEPLVKWSGEPYRPEDAPLLASKAMFLARSAPYGPVYISVPLDDWDREADESTLTYLRARTVHADPLVPHDALIPLVKALSSASNPVLVLGPGVDTELGWKGAISLAEKLNAPVWVAPSPPRAPFPTRHPLFRGILPASIGMVNEHLAGHDVIAAFGAAIFRYHAKLPGDYLPKGASLWAVTSDPDEASRAPFGQILVGDPSDAIHRVADAIPHSNRTPPAPVVRSEPASDKSPFIPEAIMDSINRAKTPDTIIALEWTSVDMMWDRFDFNLTGSYYFPAGGGLGWGMPASIGIKLARPDRPVVALIGDGALQYTVSGLWTAARYSVPVTFIVCQNEEYGALARFSRLMHVPDAAYLDLPAVDIVKIAEGYGIESRRIDSTRALEDFVRDGQHSSKPRLAVVPQLHHQPDGSSRRTQ